QAELAASGVDVGAAEDLTEELPPDEFAAEDFAAEELPPEDLPTEDLPAGEPAAGAAGETTEAEDAAGA
ncbi:MAG TPA: hypothetical protein VKS60_22735, partial [Stellaceae bacterium]|nr:hypothetical protein [Stellaceae bacterium]